MFPSLSSCHILQYPTHHTLILPDYSSTDVTNIVHTVLGLSLDLLINNNNDHHEETDNCGQDISDFLGMPCIVLIKIIAFLLTPDLIISNHPKYFQRLRQKKIQRMSCFSQHQSLTDRLWCVESALPSSRLALAGGITKSSIRSSAQKSLLVMSASGEY